MTGLEWEACDDPRLMVECLARREAFSPRKWRLFIAAFWRWWAIRLTPPQELLERSADMEVWAETGKLPAGQRSSNKLTVFFAPDPVAAALRTVQMPLQWIRGGPEASRKQAELLRDIFGNPFRLPPFAEAWRTPDVIDIARGIYHHSAFDRFPFLYDALIDAGGHELRILEHCHPCRQHVRGCWLLDLILGKS